jgi:hypothetical protein
MASRNSDDYVTPIQTDVGPSGKGSMSCVTTAAAGHGVELSIVQYRGLVVHCSAPWLTNCAP